MLRALQRGDTIIEVLLAVTVFSMVAVGSMTIMNRSANVAQQAIEITLVRQQVDAQVEAIRAAHQAYSRLSTEEMRGEEGLVWKRLTEPSLAGTTLDVSSECPKQTVLIARQAFAMDPQSAQIIPYVNSMDSEGAPVFPRVDSVDDSKKSFGIWIEPRLEEALDTSFPDGYDFRVRACWYGAGTGKAPMKLETTVRLYEIK